MKPRMKTAELNPQRKEKGDKGKRELKNDETGKHIKRDKTRGENGRKRSVNTKTIFVFIFFLGNEIENGNSENENDVGNSETSETKSSVRKLDRLRSKSKNSIGKNCNMYPQLTSKIHASHTFI
jgi:hypothetical protein